MGNARAALRARLRRAVPAAHHARRTGLRLRFPRRHRADARARNSLIAAKRRCMRRTIREARRLVAAHHAGRRHAAPTEAHTIARRLVDSNLVGHDSHGVLRVGKYLEWVRDGLAEAQHAAVDRVRQRHDRDRRRQPRLRAGDRRVRQRSSASRKAAKSGHRDGRPAQLRASRARRRLGRDGGRGRPGVAALPQHVGRAARRAVRRQRSPAVDQSDRDRRAGRRRRSRRSSTSRRRRSPKAS